MFCYGFWKPNVQICVAFENNCCFASNCGFLHRYKYCFKYQNTTCPNEKCPYLHCTSLEQLRYETTGRETDNLKKEVGRTLQSSSICGDFKNGICKRTKCKLRHVKFDIAPLQCRICTENITIGHLGAADCGHMFCYNCALRCFNNTDDDEQVIKVRCPLCREVTPYKNLL